MKVTVSLVDDTILANPVFGLSGGGVDGITIDVVESGRGVLSVDPDLTEVKLGGGGTNNGTTGTDETVDTLGR